MGMKKQPDAPASWSWYNTEWGRGSVAVSQDQIVRIILPWNDTDEQRDAMNRGLHAEEESAPTGTLATAVQELEKYFQTGRSTFTVPLELSLHTQFQRRVVEATMSIPPGEVRTYGWLAAQASSPMAFRACGQVMARNRFPVIVPCHRVVAAGGIGGFGGSLDWKRHLLTLEGMDWSRF